MTASHHPHHFGRRTFMMNLGKGTAAFAVFSPVILSACASGDSSTEESSTPSSAGEPPPTTATPTTAPPTTEAIEPLTVSRVSLGFVSAYVLVRGRRAAVVDTGVEGSAIAIKDVLGSVDMAWSDVDHLLLTHYHPDHVGSLDDVAAAATSAKIYAGELDARFIPSPRKITAVHDGDAVFGLQVLDTPGHTPGHISIYDEAGGILIAGDALNGGGSGIVGPDPEFSADMDRAITTAKRLAGLPLKEVYFGHGSPVTEDAMQRLKELADSL